MIVNPPIEKNVVTPKQWYEKWWFTTLLISLFCGLFTGYSFESFKVGAGVFIVAAIVVNYFNPRYRFMRAGFAALSVAVFNATPLLNLKIEFSQETLNGKFGFFLNWGDATNAWFIAPFIMLAIVLFVLAYLENKSV